ncbi:MAG: molybdopterin-guanine dinucleotide biosynthesis protein B [Rhodospirillaceae bacterium]
MSPLLSEDDLGFGPCAILCHDREENPEPILARFAAALRQTGVHIGGVIPRTTPQPPARARMDQIDVATGEVIAMSQELGLGSTACRLDPAGLAEAARRVGEARQTPVQLLFGGKFGDQEIQGQGLSGEVLPALADGLPTVLMMRQERLEAWTKVSGGLGTVLPARFDALWHWFGDQVRPLLASGTDDPVPLPPIFGLVGWSGAGKTTLTEALIRALTARGLTVSTIKHAHHGFDMDRPGKDTWRHREAGAREVMVASGSRWALLHEHRDKDPTEDIDPLALVSRMAPADLVLIEGYGRQPIPRLEVWRPALERPRRSEPDDPFLCAVALPDPEDENTQQAFFGAKKPADSSLPLLDLNTPDQIADWLLQALPVGVTRGK